MFLYMIEEMASDAAVSPHTAEPGPDFVTLYEGLLMRYSTVSAAPQ